MLKPIRYVYNVQNDLSDLPTVPMAVELVNEMIQGETWDYNNTTRRLALRTGNIFHPNDIRVNDMKALYVLCGAGADVSIETADTLYKFTTAEGGALLVVNRGTIPWDSITICYLTVDATGCGRLL